MEVFRDAPYYISPKLTKLLADEERGVDEESNNSLDKLRITRTLELAFIKAVKEKDDKKIWFLLKSGIYFDCVDADGLSALHHAAADRDLDNCAYLIFLGADIKCQAYQSLKLEDKQHVSIIVNNYKKYDSVTSVQKLLAKTTVHSHNQEYFESKLPAIYKALAQNDDINVIARLVAFDDSVEIHVDNDRETIERLYAGKTSDHGLAIPSVNEIYIAAKMVDKQTQGTIIHEFTHLACHRIWKNNCKPYALNSNEQEEMNRICNELHRISQNTVKRKEYPEILMDAFSYKQELWGNELIARVPEIIVIHGREILSQKVPTLLAFYDKVVLAAGEYFEKLRDQDLAKKLAEFKKETAAKSDMSQQKAKPRESKSFIELVGGHKGKTALVAGGLFAVGAVGYILGTRENGRNNGCFIM